MKKIYVMSLLVTSSVAATAQYRQVNMTVFGMDCPPCAFAVRLSMKSINGISGVDVDLNRGLVSITMAPGSKATMRQLNEATEKNGFAHQEASVLVQGVLSGSANAPMLQVSGTNDHYALIPLAAGIDLSGMLGKTVLVQGILPKVPRGQVPETLRWKKITVTN